MKDVQQLQQDLEEKKAKIKAMEERVNFTADKLKLRKRELRDQVRYAIGGLVLDKLCNKYPWLRDECYNMAMTRDKKKMIELGFHDGNLTAIKQTNKIECKQSAKKAGNSTALSAEEMDKVKEVLDKNVYRKIYGREKELFVYIGDNMKMYISDNVGKFLQENEGFET